MSKVISRVEVARWKWHDRNDEAEITRPCNGMKIDWDKLIILQIWINQLEDVKKKRKKIEVDIYNCRRQIWTTF